jgi:putative ABC transport system permease protein
MMRTWFKRLTALFRKPRLERELDEEIRTHLAMAEDENLRQGMTPLQAREAARRSFGGVEQIKEDYRHGRGIHWIETLLQDVRYGVRTLARTPGFTLTALATLALGIGATTAVFSVVYAALLRSLPYPNAERLVWVTSVPRAMYRDRPELGFRWDFVALRDRAKSFSHITAYSTGSRNFSDSEGAQRIETASVSTDFLATLGIRPALGRDFVHHEEKPGGGHVVLLTHGFWQQRFGGDQGAVGQKIVLNSTPFTVVGVLPPDFVFPLPTSFDVKLLQPMEFNLEFEKQRGIRRFHSIAARLAPGVSAGEAHAELDALRLRVDELYPIMKQYDREMLVRPLHEQLSGEARTPLLILFGAVACVLWIACLNVANLLLAKCAVRRREMAIRGALGAGRTRLVRQLLTESALLAAGGCLAGMVLSGLLRQGLAAIRPSGFYHAEISALDVSVLVFAVGVSALTAIAFGMLPAFTASRTAPMTTLKAGVTHASASRQRRGLLNALVAGQLSLALVLLIAAGLMVESFQRLRFRNLGFRTEGVLTAYFSLDRSRYGDEPRQLAFFEQVLERAGALPGVDSTALSAGLPPGGMVYCQTGVYAEGTTPPEPGSFGCVSHQAVSPAYFSTLEIPLLQGRPFSGKELPADNVAIVSEAFAQAFFGLANPIGKRYRDVGGDNSWRTIVGVAADTKNHTLGANPEPHVYTPFQADVIAGSSSGSLIVTTHGRAESLAAALRQVVHQIDPRQAMGEIETFDQRLTRWVSRERFLTWVLTAFAVLAVTLAAVGVYGVVAYMVRQRRQEIGVRLALGAEPADILRHVLFHGAKLLAVGALLGVAGSFAATRVLESYLFEVSATDWKIFSLAAAALAAVAAFACFWPARRASRTDPLSALRYE